MRPSKRQFDEMRAASFERNVSKHAEGSCLVKFGDTHVLCTASLEEKVPGWMRNTGKGWVTAEYGMLPRSTGDRMRREASAGKQGGRTLALGRNLVSYVIAADLIDLRSYNGAKDQRFRAWLSAVRTASLDGKTLISTHEERPNNWGTHAGASRIAADMYLGDTGDLARAAAVFKGWLGDRAAYAGFAYGDLAWQSDPRNPVGINPKGATLNGQNVDGVLSDDQRRAGGFTWPPQKENYVWEALQGALVQAHLLKRAGYDVWNWSDRALLRAVQWEYNVAKFPAEGDDTWQIWIVNRAYGTSFPASSAGTGKNMAYTDWMFSR